LYRSLDYEDFYATLVDLYEGRYTRPMPDVLEAFKQMGDGLSYIHSYGLTHGRIAPVTILIFPNALKLSDFGNGYSLRCDRNYCACHDKYDICYNRAPEFQRNPKNNDMYSDIFSLGCVFYIHATGGRKHPFLNEKERYARLNIRPNIFEGKQSVDGTFL